MNYCKFDCSLIQNNILTNYKDKWNIVDFSDKLYELISSNDNESLAEKVVTYINKLHLNNQDDFCKYLCPLNNFINELNRENLIN